MKNKKLIYFIIFSILFVVFFFLTIFLLANMHWFYPYETAITYEYDSKKDDRISDLKNECDNLLLAQNDYDKFIADYKELQTLYKEIGTYYKIEYLNVCKKPLKGNVRMMNIYYDKKEELSNWFSSLYSKINDSSYKNQFFDGMDEKEINYIIKYHSEEATYKNSRISSIQEEYQKLSDTEKINQFNYYFSTLVNENNAYAKILGYENYYAYSNEKEYFRDYSTEDMIQYANYINTYFLDDYIKHEGLVYDSISFKRSFNVPYLDESLLDLHYSKWEDKNITYLYAESLGSDYYNAFDSFKKDGILIESTDEDCFDGGFTTYLSYLEKPAMYLGNTTYQNIFVYLHEFGHYYNFTKAGANDESLDLCETQSQANELLFLSYLLENGIIVPSSTMHLIASRLQYFVQMAVHTALIGLVEYEAYNLESITEAQVATLIDDVATKYLPNIFNVFKESSFKNYLMNVVIDHPLYYFSYSTSICASLEIFHDSINSFTDAKEKYLYIQNYNNYDGFVNTLKNAGLNTPFEEEFFIDLSTLFKDVNDQYIKMNNKYYL